MVIRYDLSTVTETVDTAFLKLHVKSVLSNGIGVCTLKTITSDWNNAECSWFNAKAGTPWTVPGGDFTSEGAVVTKAGESGGIEVHDVTALVNVIISGTKPNYGFILEPGTSTDLTIQMQDHIYFSSEYSEVSKRPELVLKIGGIGIRSKHLVKRGPGVQLARNRAGMLTLINPNGKFTATLVNLRGQVLKKTLSQKGSILLDVNDVGNGVLILHISSNNGIEVFPLVR